MHFLAVGNGDCTITELPDNRLMIVDICNGRFNRSEANLNFENPIRYLNSLNSYSTIYRYVQTHPEMDHMDGLSDLASRYEIINFWDTRNDRARPSSFQQNFREEDWDAYAELHDSDVAKFRIRSSNPIGYNGQRRPYEIYALSPSEDLLRRANRSADWNLLSYVLLLVYEGFKLLIGGDASDEAWQDIYGWTQNDEDARTLLSNITVFKTSHHGRSSSYCGGEILDIMRPQKIVISRGSVPTEESAYGNYYYWAGQDTENLLLTSQGTIIVDYYNKQTRRYSVNQLGG